MTAVAGQTLVAEQVSGERIATDIVTANSAGFTALTAVQTVVAPLVVDRTYRVRSVTHFSSTVAGDRVLHRIQEDSTAGTTIQTNRVFVATATNYFSVCETEYTAVATEDKTFVVSGAREGSGTATRVANATQPALFYVDYIRGGG